MTLIEQPNKILIEQPMTEQVLVIPTEDAIKALDLKVGWNPLLAEAIDYKLLCHPSCQFMDRDRAEQDPTYLQIIPYCIIVRGGLVFQYRRGKGSGEERLRKNRSLGIGGHVTNQDSKIPSTAYYTGMYRELQEEVGLLQSQLHVNLLVGVIYDTSNEVGRVHLGLVQVCVMKSDQPLVIGEDQIEHSGFVNGDFFIKHLIEFESWSKILIKSPLLATPQKYERLLSSREIELASLAMFGLVKRYTPSRTILTEEGTPTKEAQLLFKNYIQKKVSFQISTKDILDCLMQTELMLKIPVGEEI